MKFYSEKTKDFYESADLCQKAEEEFDRALAKKEENEKALKAERKTRAKEVTEAYKAVKDAEDHYIELRNQFVKDYGSFHMTYTDTGANSLLSNILSLFDF